MLDKKPKFELGERCFQFSLKVVTQVNYFKESKVPYSLIDQFVRAATSIGANVIEGQGSSSDKEFLRYYRIALKSANESKYWLRLIKEGFLNNNENIDSLTAEVYELSNIIASIIIKINKRINEEEKIKS
jgi:four helix bundle protein